MYEIATIGSLTPCCAGCAAGTSCESMGEIPSEAAALTAAGLLPSVVFPSDVDAFKARLDPEMRTTEGSASRCASLSSGDAIAWGDFYTEWRKFADRPTPLVSSWTTELEIAKSYETRLRDWQTKLARECAMRGPEPGSGSGPGGVPWGKLAIGAAVLGVVGLLGYSFYRAGSQAARRASKGQAWLEGRIDDHVFGPAGGGSRALARR